MADERNEEAAAVPEVVQTAREQPGGALLPSRSGVLPALPDDIPDADVPALLEDIERRVEALPGAFDAALARRQVVAVNAMAVAMQARNLRRVTDRALALIEARLAVLMPANPPGRPPQPAGKPDGQLAGSDAAEPEREQTAAPMPADPSGRPSQPAGKPDGQLAGSDTGEPDRGPTTALAPVGPPGRPPQPAGKLDGQLAGSDAAEPEREQTAAPMPADPSGRPSQPAGKPDGQPAGSDAAESGRVQAATPMPADPSGRPPQPAGKPDGQPAGSDAAEPGRVQAATPMPADPSGRPPQPAGKPDGQPAGSDAAEPGRVQAATPMPADPSGRLPQPAGKPDGQPASSDAAEPGRVQAAAPMPADPSGRPPQPAGKPDGQPASSDAAEPGRVQAAAPLPTDPFGRLPQPAGKPDGQPAGSDAREPDRAQLPSARTMRDIRAAHPDPADKHALRERMDRLENRGARVSRRALIAEVRREQTEPADAPVVDGLPEPVADTRPLPVVHHADLDEHPLDSGSVDVVAMYASDAQDDLDPCCPFAETVLRPGGVLLLCCEVGAEEAIKGRVTEDYGDGQPASLACLQTLAMVHGDHWWPVLVFVRLGDQAHRPERTAYVGDDERACWRAILADWTYPADGLVCDLCADDARILGAADAAKLRAVGLCPDEEQVEHVRAEVAQARGAPQE